MKKRLIELLLISILFVITISITYARFQLTDNITGSINVYSSNYCLEKGFTKLSDCMLVMENYSDSVDNAKSFIQSKGIPTTLKTSPIIEFKEIIETQTAEETGVIYTTAHFTLADSYTFNKTTGMFELKNYHNVELTDEYINYYTCGSTQGTWITCTTLYQIKSYRSELDSNGNKIYKITKANVHYSNEVSSFDSEVGLYSTEDNDGTTYFYRGDVKNNYVSFGGFIWRIVRINGDGNIRMIYQGTSTNSTGEDAIISSSVYNDKQIDPTYMGYKYSKNFIYQEANNTSLYEKFTKTTNYYFGKEFTYNETTHKFGLNNSEPVVQLNWAENYQEIIDNYPYTCKSLSATGECDYIIRVVGYKNSTNMIVNLISYSSSNYEGTLQNTTDSTIKGVIDTWYKNNLLNATDSNGKKITGYLGDSYFCNERGLYNGTGYLISANTKYNSYTRTRIDKSPNLICSQASDMFSTSSDVATLEYPVGLITADEISYAGGAFQSLNSKYYLNIGYPYWTMTPSYFLTTNASIYLFNVQKGGNIGNNTASTAAGVRPVINLKSDIEIIRGTGTADDPYIITE